MSRFSQAVALSSADLLREFEEGPAVQAFYRFMDKQEPMNDPMWGKLDAYCPEAQDYLLRQARKQYRGRPRPPWRQPLFWVAIAVAAVGLFLFAASACGQQMQDKAPPAKAAAKDEEPAARRSLPVGWSKLGLTGSQKERVYVIRSQTSGQVKKLEKQIADLRLAEQTACLEVLTEAQKNRLVEIAKEKAGLKK